MHSAAEQKRLGAFYTPPLMAAALVDWAIRDASDTVLDPCFGGLAFLGEARRRLAALGASRPSAQLYGVDVDHAAFSEASELARDGATLIRRDFLRVSPRGRALPAVTAVVGNPPYVRYQAQKDGGELARVIAERHGLRLSRLSSSWAAQLLHAVDFVASGGRLAQVLPAELLHTQYAEDILGYVCRQFERVTVSLFEEAVFPGAQEEVLLLCADGRGEGAAAGVEVQSALNLDDLRLPVDSPEASVSTGHHKLIAGLVEPEAIELYDAVAEGSAAVTLGALASVDIGAVTGANAFFVRRPHEVEAVPSDFLRHAISKAAHIPGARVGSHDLDALGARGVPTKMLVLGPDLEADRVPALRTLIEQGESEEIHTRYKCRIRSPWWALPQRQVSDPPALFLTYMAADYPRLVLNDAAALSTNSVHGVRLHNGTDPAALVVSFYSSLSMLSAELVGRSYGGGVLKLEPTEAERLLVASPKARWRRLLPQIDELLRARDHGALAAVVDQAVLVEGLGLSPTQVQCLRRAADRLRGRRLSRSRHRV